jgi:hypothetical protein
MIFLKNNSLFLFVLAGLISLVTSGSEIPRNAQLQKSSDGKTSNTSKTVRQVRQVRKLRQVRQVRKLRQVTQIRQLRQDN